MNNIKVKITILNEKGKPAQTFTAIKVQENSRGFFAAIDEKDLSHKEWFPFYGKLVKVERI